MTEQEFTDRAKRFRLRADLSFSRDLLERTCVGFSVKLEKQNKGNSEIKDYPVHAITGWEINDALSSVFREALKLRIESLTKQIAELEEVGSMEGRGFKRVYCSHLMSNPKGRGGCIVEFQIPEVTGDCEVECWYRGEDKTE